MKTRFKKRALQLCLTGLLWAQLGATTAWAQAPLPNLGGDEDLPALTERKIGDRIYREVHKDPDFLDDPVLVDYVQSIWTRLIQASKERGDLQTELEERFAWKLFVARDSTVNAFALPGGYMGIHTGLIGMTQYRAEVAAVLAHELSHVTQRHIARSMGQQSRQAPWIMAAMLIGAAMMSRSPDLANAAIVGGQAASIQGQLNYSRDMEREADRVGYGVLLRASYEASGMTSMFELLEKANRLNDSGHFPYLRSHPMTSERLADASARLVNDHRSLLLTPDPLARLMAARAKVLSGGGMDRLRTLSSQGQDGAESAPDKRLGQLYGAALASHLLGQNELAREQYRKLQKTLESPLLIEPEVQVAVAALGVEIGLSDLIAPRSPKSAASTSPSSQEDLALTAVLQALQARAQTPRLQGQTLFLRTLRMLQSQAWLQTGQWSRVSDTMPTWLATHPQDSMGWRILATAQRLQGLEMQAVRSEAEAQAAEQDYGGAVERLRAAQKLPQAAQLDHYEQSILQSRLRALTDLRRAQVEDEMQIR